MARYVETYLPFLASDVTVPINTTYYHGTNFTSKEISLLNARFVAIHLFAQGAGTNSLNVTFVFQAYNPCRNMWDTVAFLSQAVTTNGTSAVQKTITISPEVSKIRLYSINNPETTAGNTVTCNAYIYLKEEL